MLVLNVNVDQRQARSILFPVASVQNASKITLRHSDRVCQMSHLSNRSSVCISHHVKALTLRFAAAALQVLSILCVFGSIVCLCVSKCHHCACWHYSSRHHSPVKLLQCQCHHTQWPNSGCNYSLCWYAASLLVYPSVCSHVVLFWVCRTCTVCLPHLFVLCVAMALVCVFCTEPQTWCGLLSLSMSIAKW